MSGRRLRRRSAAAGPNTSVVIGDRLLLKAYRHVQPGLNPDLELTAYLSEEAGFTGVPRLAGWAEAVTRDGGVATVAMLQAFVPMPRTCDERTAEFLADLIAAPGSVSLEWATDVAADVGTLVAGLHAALASPPADAPDLAPREATHDELKAWRWDAHRQLNLALDAVGSGGPGGRGRAPARRLVHRRAPVAVRGRGHRPHGDAHPRRPPPGPAARRRRRLSRDRLRGRRRCVRSRTAAGRTPRCATSPRCCGRWTTSPGTPAAGPTPRTGGSHRAPEAGHRRLDRACPGAVPGRLRRGPAAIGCAGDAGPRPARRVRGRAGDPRARVRRHG